MEEALFPSTAQEIGALTKAQVVGDPTRGVHRFSSLQNAGKGGLSYCNNPKFKSALSTAIDSVVFIRSEWVDPALPITYLVVDEPREAFVQLTRKALRQWAVEPGTLSSTAAISGEAILSVGVTVAPLACIEKGVKIGAHSFIGAGCVIGSDTVIGENCKIHPRVVIYPGTEIGDRVEIFSGAILGSDGFGLMDSAEGASQQMPHIGKVVIENDVRIGAGTTIDRGTLGETRISSGVKVDNLVHIAHNCQIGKNSIVCAQSGLSGSVVLEKNVILGGQVGIKNGVTIGEGARVGAQAGVANHLEGGDTYTGTPAQPAVKYFQMLRSLRKLPRLFDSVLMNKALTEKVLTEEEAQS